jgi:hypothetical protein
MDSGWNQVNFVGSHSRGYRHKWIALMDFEELGHALYEYGWSEGPEGLPMLHTRIQLILHHSVPGIRQNGTVAECARARLKSILKPTHDFAFGQIACHSAYELTLTDASGCQSGASQGIGDLDIAIRKAIEWMCEFEPAGMSQRLMIMPKRAA